MCIRQLVFVIHNNGNIFWKKERKKLIVKKRTMQFKFMYLITTFSFGFEIQSRNLGVNVRIDGFYKIIQVNIFRILTISYYKHVFSGIINFHLDIVFNVTSSIFETLASHIMSVTAALVAVLTAWVNQQSIFTTLTHYCCEV